MNNLNDSLPDLMRRATDDLEPESNDLVERGIQRGVTLRRRRTAMLGLSGAGAVLATAGIIVGGTHLFAGSTPEPTVAGPSTAATPSAPATPSAVPSAKATSPAQTLATLRALLPSGLKQSAPRSGNDNGLFSAHVVLDDGKGASLVTVKIVTTKPNPDCAGLHGTCQVRPDGSVIHSYANESIVPFAPERDPNGIKNTVVEVFHPDGRLISLYSYNSPKQIVPHTRANPLLTVKQLTAIANSDQWVYPPAVTGLDEAGLPPNGKPTVPLEQTQQQLKSVLPRGLQFTRPETWGGGTNGFNGASYVINDGKGAARVDALVQYETTPVTKCTGEGPQHCKVRSDGAVIGWSKNEPSYGDERQAINGVLANRVELHYPDGRMISMTSYNGPTEKNDQHTRAKPMFSTDQLFAMAGKPGWKFPGTGTK